jgi:inosose dehydratase
MNRRQTLATLAAATFGTNEFLRAAEKANIHIASNTYPWTTFARRSGEKFSLHSESLLADIASTGVHGYEPIINSPAEFEGLGGRLEQHGLEMRSIYVNSMLHDESKADTSIETVTRIAAAAHALGTRIVVTNPSPIKWGGGEDKSDAQLRFQAKSLDVLGAALRELGLQLAYHNHDAELRNGAREFHHMLTATDPQNVKFCLDAHWVFRGCGDSEVAVFDALEHYHERIVELHLRQSQGGVWTEAFSPKGDIDYVRLVEFLGAKDIRPHLVLEQAVEKDSPKMMSAVEAHRRGREQLAAAL